MRTHHFERLSFDAVPRSSSSIFTAGRSSSIASMLVGGSRYGCPRATDPWIDPTRVDASGLRCSTTGSALLVFSFS